MLRMLVLVLLVVLMLAVAVVVGVLASPAGSRLIADRVEQMLAPRLTITGLSGSALGELCAERVRYEQPGVRVLVEGVCVEANVWSSFDFLAVSLQSVDAERVQIETEAAEPPDGGPTALTLPLGITAENVRIGALSVNATRLVDIDANLSLRNTDLAIATSFTFADRRVTMRTRGPWDALHAEVVALGVNAEVSTNLQDDALPFRISARARTFDLTPFVDRAVRLDQVSVQGQGDLSGYRFDAGAGVTDPSIQGQLRVSGRGDWAGMTFASIQIRDATLTDMPLTVEEATGRGRLTWSDGFGMHFESMSSRGVLDRRPLRAELATLELDTSAATLAGGALHVLQSGRSGVLRVDGQVGYDGHLALDLSGSGLPLGLADERFSGSAMATLQVRGALSDPALKGSFTLTDAGYQTQMLGSLSGRLDGRLDRGTVDFDADTPQGEAQGQASYRMTDEGVDIGVATLDLRPTSVAAGARLAGAASVSVSRSGRVMVPRACLELYATDADLDTARACFAVDYPDGGLTVDVEPWTLPATVLPAGAITLRGVASARVRLDSFAPLSGSAHLDLSGLVAEHEGVDPLNLGAVTASATLGDKAVDVTLATPAGVSQALTLSGRAHGSLESPVGASPVSGELALQIDGLWAARTLLPMEVTFELDRMRGTMEVRADLKGTIGEPLVNGTLVLRDAGWLVQALNTEFSDVRAEARLTDTETITFSSQGSIGKGSLAVSGRLVGLSTPTPELFSDFKLDRAQVVDLPDYSARLSGTVHLEMGTDTLRLMGDLEMPTADIRIGDLPETAVGVSSDEVIVDAETSANTQQIRTTNLNLTLGNRVWLDAFGLRSRLVGNLRLEESPGKLQSVTGTISLKEGTFEAYGQELTVERGQLTFTGPLDNPTVDVQATRVVTYEERDYRISLLLSGSAKDLVTSLRSQPALPEDDALALLLTGKTLSDISAQERSNVNGAALSMGLLNAMGVTQNLADRLNLEEIIVDQDTEGNMEVGAAVRVNRDFYLRYTYGVFSRLGGVLLRYRLNTRLSVQAQTGDATSIEIRYGVDD
ncbi:MAG: translocation/assembly module TamB domain-containing protein [Pseudomonadales bacterium]|jgi:autotransporter translocation and assembly factor TamB